MSDSNLKTCLARLLARNSGNRESSSLNFPNEEEGEEKRIAIQFIVPEGVDKRVAVSGRHPRHENRETPTCAEFAPSPCGRGLG